MKNAKKNLADLLSRGQSSWQRHYNRPQQREVDDSSSHFGHPTARQHTALPSTHPPSSALIANKHRLSVLQECAWHTACMDHTAKCSPLSALPLRTTMFALSLTQIKSFCESVTDCGPFEETADTDSWSCHTKVRFCCMTTLKFSLLTEDLTQYKLATR